MHLFKIKGIRITPATYFLCLLFFIAPSISYSQTPAHSGTDFRFTRLTGWDQPNLYLYITSSYTTSGKVDLGLFEYNTTYPFSVKAGETVVIKLESSLPTMMVGFAERRIVHVISEKPIEVTAHTTTVFAHREITTLLPTSALGYEYFSLNQTRDPSSSTTYSSNFVVLALEDNTLVEITSKFSTSTDRPAHVPYTVKLKAGEMYRENGYNQTDLSGSRIRSISDGNHGRKKIAVYSSNIIQRPQQEGYRLKDHFFQQLYPLRLWGQEYVAAPFLGRDETYSFKLVAAHCNTKVSFNGSAPVTINQGESYQFSSDKASHIVADKPISVAQYFHPAWDNNNGSPETVMLAPVEQGVTETLITSQPYTNIQEHFISIVIPTSHSSTFRLDGTPVSFKTLPSNAAFSYAVKKVGPGKHVLKAAIAFNAVAYGTTQDLSNNKPIESYGFAVNAGIPSVRHQKISFEYDPLCGGETISFKSQTEHPALSWLWHFGDGSTSTERNPTHTYAQPGHYEVSLTSVGNDIYNCNSEMTTTVDLQVFSTSRTTVSASAACFGNATSFQAVSNPANGPNKVVAWEWDFGDGTSSTGQNPTHTYTSAGTYTATLTTSTVSGCSSEVQVDVVVHPLPALDFSIPSACQLSPVSFTVTTLPVNGNNIVSWLWDFGDGTTSTEQHPQHTFKNTGDYQVTLEARTQLGCSQKTAKVIRVHPTVQPQFEASAVCLGQNVVFNNTTVASGNISYKWDLGDGTFSDLPNLVHTYKQVGTYTVTLTATTEAGCTSSSTNTVVIFPKAQAAFSPLNACESTSFLFRDESILQTGKISGWHWDFGDGSTTTQQHPLHMYRSAGTYTVRLVVTSDQGCTSMKEEQVTVHPLLTANAGAEQLLPYGSPSTTLDATMPPTGLGTWTILSGTGGSISDSHDPKTAFTGTVGQSYTLRWTVQGSGCHDAYDDVKIKLSVVLTEHLKIPNGFSPNGDGINDVWQLEGIEAFPGIQIRIINRWGDQVYQSNGYSIPWNGTRNGGPLPDGAYYYFIDAGLGADHVLKGSVTILR